MTRHTVTVRADGQGTKYKVTVYNRQTMSCEKLYTKSEVVYIYTSLRGQVCARVIATPSHNNAPGQCRDNNCFIKSTLFGLREGPPPHSYNYIDPVVNEVQEMAKQLYTAKRIRELINI